MPKCVKSTTDKSHNSNPNSAKFILHDEARFRAAVMEDPSLLHHAAADNAGAALREDNYFLHSVYMRHPDAYHEAPPVVRDNLYLAVDLAIYHFGFDVLLDFIDRAMESGACVEDKDGILRLLDMSHRYDIPEVEERLLALLDLVPASVWEDKALAITATFHDASVFDRLAPEMREDEDLIRAILSSNPLILGQLLPVHRANKELVRIAVSYDGLALQFAADHLKEDVEIAVAALRSDGNAFAFVALAIRLREEVVRAALRSPAGTTALLDYFESREKLVDRGRTIPEKNESGTLDRSTETEALIAAKAVAFERLCKTHDYQWAVRVAPMEMRRDRRFVLDVITYHDPVAALRFADDSLRADPEIVSSAINESRIPAEWRQGSEWVTDDLPWFVTNARKRAQVLACIDPALQSSRDVVLAAVSANGCALEFADERIRADRDVVYAAVRSTGLALQYADPRWKSDRDVVMEAVTSHGPAIQFASEALRADRIIVMEAVRDHPSALAFVAPHFREDPELIWTVSQSMRDGFKEFQEHVILSPSVIEAVQALEAKQRLHSGRIWDAIDAT